VGSKTPKLAPSPWDIVTLPEEDRATVKGNMHKIFGKDRACGSGDIKNQKVILGAATCQHVDYMAM